MNVRLVNAVLGKQRARAGKFDAISRSLLTSGGKPSAHTPSRLLSLILSPSLGSGQPPRGASHSGQQVRLTWLFLQGYS